VFCSENPPHVNIREITSADIPALFHVRPRTRQNALTVEELRALGITPESVATWLAWASVWPTEAQASCSSSRCCQSTKDAESEDN
jgi:hypothetical protein